MTGILPSPTQAVANRETALLQELSNELRTPGHRLQPFTRLREDLFLDTVDVELLVASLEQNLGYYLTEEEATQIETIGDIRTFFLR